MNIGRQGADKSALGAKASAEVHRTQRIRQRMGPAVLLALLGAVIGLMLYLEHEADTARHGAASAYIAEVGGSGGVVVGVYGAVKRPGVYRLPALPAGEGSPEDSQPRGSIMALLEMAGLNLPEGISPPGGWGGGYLQAGDRIEVMMLGDAPGLGYGELDDQTKVLFDIPLDLNQTSPEGLTLLPGIGPKTAQAIVDHRTSMGGFTRLEDLLGVKGVGPKTLDALRPHVKLEAPVLD